MTTVLTALILLGPVQDVDKPQAAAAKRGVVYLKKSQEKDGHWGGQYSIAISGMAGLALLSAQEDPFASPHIRRAVTWLMGLVKKGSFPKQGHSWIHGQGFATLFLSEVYGRARAAKEKPDLDLERLKETVGACVKAIEAAQSSTGGWWYTADQAGGHAHEGSTTVCAVQALSSAASFGIKTDSKVIAKGFTYLKRTQNKNGSFQYKLGDGTQMKEGTASAVATLALMRKLDYPVLLKGCRYLNKITADSITKARFPYYGHFYSTFGMKLVWEEMGRAVPFAKKWHNPVEAWLLKTQEKDGGWKMLNWMAQHGKEGQKRDYSTALSVLILTVRSERLSIFRR